MIISTLVKLPKLIKMNFFEGSIPMEHGLYYFVADYRPLETEPNRIRCIIGGDKLGYMRDIRSPTTNCSETRFLFNIIISDAAEGAIFMTCDLKEYFLAFSVKEDHYTRVR